MIGLTGAVGAGKSTVSAELALAGALVIDVDRMGHDVLAEPDVRDAVVRELGPDVTGADGALDRRALAARVFVDRSALARLEAIVHPAVAQRLRTALDAARSSAARAVVVDCALLFEGGLAPLCDATVVVETDEALRLRRVAASRGWTEDETRRRESAQLPASEKAARADRVLRNDGTPDELRARVRHLLDAWAPIDRSPGVPGSGRN